MRHERQLIALATLLFITTFIGNAHAENPKFAWFSLAPEVGYTFFSRTKLEDAFPTYINARHGIVVKGHVDIGGDKLALELAPTYAWESCSGQVGNLNAFGGEATLVYRFKSDNIYPSIGIGFHGAYLFSNPNISRGVELFGRVPLGMTWYFLKYVGLVLEGGFMFGGTGIHFKDRDLYPNTEYAFNLGFDLLVGLRFP